MSANGWFNASNPPQIILFTASEVRLATGSGVTLIKVPADVNVHESGATVVTITVIVSPSFMSVSSAGE